MIERMSANATKVSRVFFKFLSRFNSREEYRYHRFEDTPASILIRYFKSSLTFLN